MDTDQKIMAKFKLRGIAKWVIVGGIFVFLGNMILDGWHQVKEVSFTLRIFPLILSTLVFAFSYFIQLWAWYLITQKLGIALSLRETCESWFYSQLGKYLPGKVWLLLGRFYLYESKGKSKKIISTALYYEMVTIILAGGIIFLISILFRKTPLFWKEGLGGEIIFALIVTFLLIHPRFLQKVMNWILRQFKKEEIAISISYVDIMKILVICILAWLIGGIGFYLFVDSIYSVPSKQVLFLTGALAISSTLGLIAVFAPAGLGVREGSLVYLLTYIVPAPIAVILSVATRLWMTFIEIGLIGVVYMSSKIRKNGG